MTHYRVQLDDSDAAGAGVALDATHNLLTGLPTFEEHFGEASSLECDLLLLAASVFAVDRAEGRGEREEFVRNISLSVPVVNTGILTPLIPLLERLLRLLSSDNWEIDFRQVVGEPEGKQEEVEILGTTLLFSGGLDSCAGALKLLSDGEPLQLVSHVTKNLATRRAQEKLVAMLTGEGHELDHFQFMVSSRDGGPSKLKHAVENTQRTRSFLFLTLAALVARQTGFRRLLMIAENGQFAIHLPLSSARMGAFSTHTGHPEFLAGMQDFLQKSLKVVLEIANPFVYLTKAEVTKIVLDNLPDAVPATTSCWKNARMPAGYTHCGECLPCFARRISIETFGNDPTAYVRDVWSEDIGALPPEDDGRRNVVELVQFVDRITNESKQELLHSFPELYSQAIDADQTIDMYKRFASETRKVFEAYPHVVALFP